MTTHITDTRQRHDHPEEGVTVDDLDSYGHPSDEEVLGWMHDWRTEAVGVIQRWREWADQLAELANRRPFPASVNDSEGDPRYPAPRCVDLAEMDTALARAVADADAVTSGYRRHLDRLDTDIHQFAELVRTPHTANSDSVPGGSSAKTSHPAGTPNHQVDSKEPRHA